MTRGKHALVRSTSIEMLAVFRFVTGLGCAMPNAVTPTSECAPEQRSAFVA